MNYSTFHRALYINAIVLFTIIYGAMRIFSLTSPEIEPIVEKVYAATVITTCTELQNMNNDLGGIYELGNNIDCSATSGWNSGAGFEPIGSDTTPFTGTFNGNGYFITDLTINRPSEPYVGLFSYTSGATLDSVGIVGGSITGSGNTGSVAGRLHATTTVSNSFSSASVSGAANTGGLVGISAAGNTITDSYTISSATGGSIALGGLVGSNAGTIARCYSSGSVSGSSGRIGGLVGLNSGTITDSYSTASVAGGSLVGGLVGLASGTITNTYATGAVSGASSLGGLIGSSSATVTSSYWDTQTSGQVASSAGTGKTTAQMKQEATFSGWDFSTTPIWDIDEDNTYPYFSFSPSMTVTESNGATTVSENGSTDTFTVVLNSLVTSDVVAAISSGDTGEATVSPATLTFTTDDWNVPQTVTVTGVDDGTEDGDQTISVTVAIDDASSDNTYDSVPDATVSVTVTETVASPATPSGVFGTQFGCQDPRAINYQERFVKHKQELCKYNKPIECPYFSRYHKRGDRGGEVAKIQDFLYTQDINPGPIDGVYGRKTDAGVKEFQVRYFDTILKPWSLVMPTGYFYQSTRKQANALYGCDEGLIELDNGVTI